MTLFEEALQRMEEALIEYQRKSWAETVRERRGAPKALDHYRAKRAAVVEYAFAIEQRSARMAETGVGVRIGLTDRDGKPVHIGDTLRFDEAEWGGPCEFTIWLRHGEIQMSGVPSDIPEWCEVIKSYETTDATE